jgi:hypothetical protein
MEAFSPEEGVGALEARVATLVDVAAEHGVGLSLEELLALLPERGPESPAELGRWLAGRPRLGTVVDRWVYSASRVPPSPAERRARAERFLAEARWASDQALRPVRPLVRTIAITGSTAFGAPEAGDDLDFLVLVRRGAVWPFLLYAYLAARWLRRRAPEGPAEWCFNYVLDEPTIRREVAEPRGLLYAREALTAHPLAGAGYYRALLRSAPWLARELPRLLPPTDEERVPPGERPAPLAIRAANLLLFPWLAAYLQAVALVRNARYRRRGEAGRTFRVLTAPGRLSYDTVRYDRLRRRYRRLEAAPSPDPGR